MSGMTRTSTLLCGVLFCFHGAVYAQTTFASITGVVTDSSGAVVPKAKITASHVETNSKFTAESNELGNYTIAQLKEGAYEVMVEAAGFKEFVAQNVMLAARDVRRVDVKLEVGAVGSRVEVSAGHTLIETETARIGDSKGAQQLKTLPLNARFMWAFLALSPNVLQGTTGSVRFAGSNSNQSHWAIDGVTFSDGVDETAMGPLANYVEWFQEFKVDISNNSAEFGPIGQVTVISKSGTNSLHGSVFDYYSTPVFRARNPFQLARGTGIFHLFGGSVSGPVVIPKVYNGRNKTFFFTSIETSRGSDSTQLLNPTVPLPSWRNGDFSGLTAGTLIHDPTTGQPFAGNRIPANRINSVSQKIQDRFYPLPNFGDTSTLQSQNYRENKTRPWDPSTNWTARGDHRFSDHDMVYGRFSFQRGFNRTYEGNLPAIGRRIQQRDNRAAGFSYTHIFKPELLNEFRYGFALNNNPVAGPINGPALANELGLQGLAPDLPDVSGILKVNWTGLGLQSITQPDYTNPGFRNHLEEFQDHVSWFRGRHSFKFGFTLTRVEWDDLSANTNLFGTVNFSSRFTGAGLAGQGHPYADFLLGIPTTAARAFPPVRVDRNRWQYDFFAVDDFRINAKLTLNLGLRYELHLPWRENHGMTSMFDIGTGNIVVDDSGQQAVSPLFPTNYANIVTASSLALPSRTLVRSDRNNFAPRIGVAYRPWGDRTVFRAGWGIFYDVVPRNLNQGGIPFVLNEPEYTNPASNPDVVFPRVFPATGGSRPSTVGLPAAVNPDIKIPYSMQYNFTIEHQRWDTGFRFSYVGTATRHGDWAYNYNSPVPDTRLFVDKPRPFPNYPAINYFTNGAGHQYNALTVSAERQMSKGLYFQGSWTWARDRYDLTRGDPPSENPFDRHREVAVAPDIPTHRLTANWMYELPFGRGKRWFSGGSRLANLVAGGWQITGVYSTYSGQFMTPLWSGPDPTGTAFTTSRTPANVTIRPDQFGDPNLPSDQRSVSRWFDPSVFGAPQPGQFGSAAKGVIKGPGVNVWHMGISKEFMFHDKAPRLRWQMTATNVFNHPNYSNPTNVSGNSVAANISQVATAGVISGVGGVNGGSTGDLPGPRALMMNLRVEW